MTKTTKQRTYIPYIALALVAAIYIAASMFTPVRNQVYQISTLQTRAIQLTLIIPIIAIWWTALYGALRFRTYATSIQGSPDGDAMGKIADGLTILVIGLIGSGIVSGLTTAMTQIGSRHEWVIFANYMSIFPSLLAYIFIYRGARELSALAPGTDKTKQIVITLLLGVLAVVYAVLMFNNPNRNFTDDAQTSSYFLPDSLIVVTLMIPLIATWYLGLMSALGIARYRARIKGTIYREALKRLAQGSVAVIIFSISIQILAALSSALRNLGLGTLLALIYVIILMYSVGFILIARGAKELSKIEEVV